MGVGLEIQKVRPEIETAITVPSIPHGDGHEIAGTSVAVIIRAVNVADVSAGSIFVEHEKVCGFPVGKTANRDGTAPHHGRQGVVYVWIGAGIEFGEVVIEIVVRVPVGTVGRAPIVGGGRLEVIRAVIERAEFVLHFPTVGQPVAVRVFSKRIRFGPCLAGVVNPVGIDIPADAPVEIIILPKAVVETITVRVWIGRAGFFPSQGRRLPGIDQVIRPIPAERAIHAVRVLGRGRG